MSWLNFIVILVAVLLGVTIGMFTALWWLGRKLKVDLSIPDDPTPPVECKPNKTKKGKKR